nr:GTP 3',8-cyclase MoaA [Corynebacterium mendelii]
MPTPTVKQSRSDVVWDGSDPFSAGPLTDRFGRVHRDLRISVTDRCSLRCTYCMPAEGVAWLPKADMLTIDEIVEVARAACRLGITQVRLTGGEPLIRPDIVDIVERLSHLPTDTGTLRLSVTTNGLMLPGLIDDLKNAGLERINISLDTVNAGTYQKLTRRDRFARAVAGVEAARDSGLRPLKINAVAMRGVNDKELSDLVSFAIDHDAQMRFIEQMPLDGGHTWNRQKMLTADEILQELSTRFDLEPLDGRGSSPAQLYRIDGSDHTVGVIASVTRPFCGDCDRVRLTADGQLRNCLFARKEQDLRTILRDGELDENDRQMAIARVLRGAVAVKKPGHGIDEPGFIQPDRPMSAIGG